MRVTWCLVGGLPCPPGGELFGVSGLTIPFAPVYIPHLDIFRSLAQQLYMCILCFSFHEARLLTCSSWAFDRQRKKRQKEGRVYVRMCVLVLVSPFLALCCHFTKMQLKY